MEVRDHVWLASRVAISAAIAFLHLGSLIASAYVVGSTIEEMELQKCLCLGDILE